MPGDSPWTCPLETCRGTVPGRVQKFSERWQGALPAGERGLPSAAFLTLVVAAAAGSVLVLMGIASAAPSLLAFLRGGG